MTVSSGTRVAPTRRTQLPSSRSGGGTGVRLSRTAFACSFSASGYFRLFVVLIALVYRAARSGAAAVASGDEADLPFPLAFQAALRQQDELLNGPTDGHGLADQEHARRWQTLDNASVRERSHGAHIVAEHHPPVLRCPFQHNRVT